MNERLSVSKNMGLEQTVLGTGVHGKHLIPVHEDDMCSAKRRIENSSPGIKGDKERARWKEGPTSCSMIQQAKTHYEIRRGRWQVTQQSRARFSPNQVDKILDEVTVRELIL